MITRTLAALTLFTLSSVMVFGANDTWTGGASATWNTVGNWAGGNPVPVNNDTLTFPTAAANFTNSNNFSPNIILNGITIDSNVAYTLNGNQITMNGPISINPTPANIAVHTINTPLLLNANLSITQANTSHNSTIAGNITELAVGSSLTYTGTGDFFLTGTNSYTGGTVISANSVLDGTTNAIPAAGGVNIGAGTAYLIFAQSFTGTYTGLLTGAGNFLVRASGQSITLTNTGNNYAGITQIDGSTTLIGTTSTIPSNLGCGLLTANAVLNFNQAISGSYTSPITGAGKVLISGGGVVTFTNAGNTYSNGTTITTGTLAVGADANMGALTSAVNLGSVLADLPVLQANATFTMGRPITVNATTSRIDPNGFILTHTTTNGGAATGAGGLHIGKVGGTAGTLQVEAPYSYTGGTFVDLGTLQLSTATATLPPAGVSPSGNLTLASGTTFDMSGAGVTNQSIGNLSGAGNTLLGAHTLTVAISIPTAYSGIISGVGGHVIKNGSATWTLSGANSYSGGTALNAGTLSAGAASTFPATGTISLVSGATLALSGFNQSVGNIAGTGGSIIFSSGENLTAGNDNTTTAYSGVIQGPGSFTKAGTGTLTLQGANSYTLGTTISAGTLAIAGAGTIAPTGPMSISGTFDISAATNPQTIGTLSGSGFLNLGAQSLTHNPTANSTFSGDITGTGTFIQNQPFTLTLSGTSTTTGIMQISQGTIKVTGTVPATFNIGPSGTLKGTGTVGAINNSGIVAPGASIGTLTVTGNYTESGTLQIEVNNAGAASLVAIGGNLTINPGAGIILVPDPGIYNKPITYTIATFAGTRTGTYSSVTTPLFNRSLAAAIYDPHDIKIEFVPVPFFDILPGVPAAKCIETIPQGKGSDGEFILTTLDLLSNDLSVLKKAFLQMQPNQYGALALAQENNDILIRSALTQRFEYRCAEDCFTLEETTPYCDETTTDEAPEEPPVKKGSAWFEPLGKYANQNNQQQNAGYRLATGGALLGADYQFLGQLDLGGAVGYTFTDLDWKKSAGKAFINSYYGTLYGTWFLKRVFVDATIISAYNHYHAQRNIDFPGIDRHANNSHSGYQIAESLGTGVFFNPGAFQITPYARADYVFLHQNSFTEHGAKSLDLKIEDTDSRYVRSDLGFKISHCHTYCNVKVTPYVKFSWIWEKQLDKARFNSSFIDSSCSFSVHGLRPVRSLFAPSIGVTVLGHEDTFSFSLYYDAEVGKKFWESRGYGNFSYKF